MPTQSHRKAEGSLSEGKYPPHAEKCNDPYLNEFTDP